MRSLGVLLTTHCLLVAALATATSASIEFFSATWNPLEHLENWKDSASWEQLPPHASRSVLNPGLERCLSNAGVPYAKKGSGDAMYEERRLRQSNTAYLDRFPEYILMPESESHVQTCVQCLSSNSVPYVIRTGAHSYRGLSLINCGAVIDTYRMATVEIDTDARVRIGAGVRLGPLYYDLWQRGLVFPGGTCASVGASGLLLSGGYGLLSRRMGVAVDHVLSARVVLTNGSAVTASSTKNSDLYFAIRGGSGSYGVVTSWRLQAHAAPPKYTQLELSFPDWSSAKIMHILDKLLSAQPWAWPTRCTVIRLYLAGGTAHPLRMVLHYLGTKAEMQAFMATQPFFTTARPYSEIIFQEGTYMDAATRANLFGRAGEYRVEWLKTATVGRGGDGAKSYASALVSGRIGTAGRQALADWAMQGGCTGTTITFLGGAAATPQRGGSTAFDGNRGSRYIIQFSSACADREKRIRDMHSRFSQFSDGGRQYMGYIWDFPNGQDPFRMLFGGTVGARLSAIKRKYDPSGLLSAVKLQTCTTAGK